MGRLLAFAALACTVVAVACGGGDDPTAPSTPNAPSAAPPALPPPSLATASNGEGLSITTDKDDYAPGDTVWFTGAGWQPGDTLDIVLSDEPQTHDPHMWSIPVNETGGFLDSTYVVDVGDVGVTFTLTATSRTTGQGLSVIFTDGRDIQSVTLNGASTVVVAGGAQISANVKGQLTGNANNTLGSIGVKVHVDGTLPSTAVPLVCYDVNPNQGPSSPGNNIPYDHTFPFNAPASQGIYDVIVTSYSDNNCSTATGAFAFSINNGITVQAGNQAPTVDAGGPYTVAEGSGIGLNGVSASDPDAGDVLAFTWTVDKTGIDADGDCSFSPSNAVLKPTVTCTDDSQGAPGGKFTLTLEVDDGHGHVVSDNAELTVTNANPTANAHGPYSGDEGSAIALTGSGDDPGNNDDDDLTFEWSVNKSGIDASGDCTFDPGNTAQSPSITCTDDSEAAAGGKFTVSLTVRDDDGGVSAASSADLTVANLPPTITAVVLAPFIDGYVYPITGQPTVNATYTDPGSNDTHTCVFEVFDYQDLEVGTDRTCGSSLGALEAGVYSVKVTVKDDDLDSDTEYAQVVIYDPSSGFVTGGGWIYSAAGAYKADLTLEGKATFGFVSKYLTQKDKTTPVLTGNTEFVFQAGNLNFHSSLYDWLVVNAVGTRAQYKGKGTINGGATLYPFILTAIDGKTGGIDQFRMQIFETDGQTVLYDNYVSGPATEQPLGGGSIVIHTGKK